MSQNEAAEAINNWEGDVISDALFPFAKHFEAYFPNTWKTTVVFRFLKQDWIQKLPPYISYSERLASNNIMLRAYFVGCIRRFWRNGLVSKPMRFGFSPN
ncbi:hypothetical protein NPIL_435531 [Nephila pilipes]|uniref:Uncharacterized protein n=1 Tax=Nephila pilipes TaxID=299642 RepID=A0A8X6N5M6_NEPPI|nr:hypothetical protein NPIL_435531 [Nephila pilipes]